MVDLRYVIICRFFTHGYRFYAPSTSVLYHLYSRQHRPTFVESQRCQDEIMRKRLSSQKVVLKMVGCRVGHFSDEEETLIQENTESYWLGEFKFFYGR